jgi:hypothetical protein
LFDQSAAIDGAGQRMSNRNLGKRQPIAVELQRQHPVGRTGEDFKLLFVSELPQKGCGDGRFIHIAAPQ